MTGICDALRRRAQALHRDESGQITAFVVILTVAFVAMLGLIVDGGEALAGRARAVDEAQEAARAGAQAINLASYRTGGPITLNPAQAIADAKAYLAATGDTGTVSVTGTSVHVSVTHVTHTQLLGVVGISTLNTSGNATATAEQGTTAPNAGN